MARLLPYIEASDKDVPSLTAMAEKAVEKPDFDEYPREKNDIGRFVCLGGGRRAYGCGAEGVVQAAIVGRGNRMDLFLVDSSLSGKALLQTVLSVAYWTLTQMCEKGYTRIYWFQPACNRFLKLLNEYLPPLNMTVEGVDVQTREVCYYRVVLDVKKALADCAAALERI